MYFSKIISVTLLAALANAAATPPVLETRQSSACNQVSSALEQTIQYYKARQGQWNGNVGVIGPCFVYKRASF
jgi:hypothetical protein